MWLNVAEAGAEHAPGEEWAMTDWATYARAVNQAARALLALLPQSATDDASPPATPALRVAILAKASAEYLVLHMACLTAGVVPVTLPASSSADQLSAILRHSEARYVFVDDDHQLRKLSSKQTLDQLDAIFRLERSTASPNDHKDASDENDNEEESRQLQQSKIISWRDFLRRGARVTQAVLEQQMQQPQSDQLASIVYASGFDHTTNGPRGMMYSHNNLLWTAKRCVEAMQLDERDISFSYLPISHITEQLLSIYCHIVAGHRVFLNGERSQASLVGDIRSVQPTRLVAPASFWKALHSWLHEQLAREVRLPLTILRAMSVKSKQKSTGGDDEDSDEDDEEKDDDDSDDEEDDVDVRPGSWIRSQGKDALARVGSVLIGSRGGDASQEKIKLSAKEVQANPLLLNLFRERMGLARLRIGYSGFAPLPTKVMAFFGKLGITVCELYAHPLATGLVACNRPPLTTDDTTHNGSDDSDSEDSDDEEAEQSNKPGTVGPVIGDVEVKLDEESVPQGDESDHGEILVKGPNVFMGFLNDAKATSDVLHDGWVRTGDVGTLDEDDLVKLKGRREDLFRLRGGELVCPWKAEKLLKASPLIEDALVLGENREHVAALLTLSSLSRALSQQDRMNAIKEAVTSANGKLDEALMIKKIATISPSTKLAHHTQCITPLGRVVRGALVDCFPKELSALYPDDEDLAKLAAARQVVDQAEEEEAERAKQTQESADSASSSDDEESSESESESERDEEEEEDERETSSALVREVEKANDVEEEPVGMTTATEDKATDNSEHDAVERKHPEAAQEQIGRTEPDADETTTHKDADMIKEEEQQQEVAMNAGEWMKGKEATPASASRGGISFIGTTRLPRPDSATKEREVGDKKMEEEKQPSTDDDRGHKEMKRSREENLGMDAALKRPQLVDLSEGVMVYLFSFLAPADLGPVALTCRRFKVALDDEVVWKLLLQRTYGTGGLLVSQYIAIPHLGVQIAEVEGDDKLKTKNRGVKAVDWRNTFINRAKTWKAHAHEDTVERLALCAKWGAVSLLRQLLADSRSRYTGDGDEWVRDVINQKTRLGGKTVLHWACEYGNASVVEHLVTAYASRGLDLNSRADIAAVGLWPHAPAGGKAPHVPLSLACESGHLDTVQILLEQEDVRTSCDVEMTLQCLVAAAEKQREAVVRFFLDRLQALRNAGTADTEEGKEEHIFRAKLWALELACERGNAKIVDDIIASGSIDLGFPLDEEDADGDAKSSGAKPKVAEHQHYHDAVVRRFRGLFRACEKGSLKTVTALLNCGLPVNMRELPAAAAARDDRGDDAGEWWTALHYAAKRGDLALVQKLVGRGANPSLTARFNGRRATPLDVAVAMDRDEGVVAYLRNITPRSSFLHRPEVLLTAAGGFFVVAVAYLLSQLGTLFFSSSSSSSPPSL